MCCFDKCSHTARKNKERCASLPNCHHSIPLSFKSNHLQESGKGVDQWQISLEATISRWEQFWETHFWSKHQNKKAYILCTNHDSWSTGVGESPHSTLECKAYKRAMKENKPFHNRNQNVLSFLELTADMKEIATIDHWTSTIPRKGCEGSHKMEAKLQQTHHQRRHRCFKTHLESGEYWDGEWIQS